MEQEEDSSVQSPYEESSDHDSDSDQDPDVDLDQVSNAGEATEKEIGEFDEQELKHDVVFSKQKDLAVLLTRFSLLCTSLTPSNPLSMLCCHACSA